MTLEDQIKKAAERWTAENLTDDAIQSYVDEFLGVRRNEILCKLLGFNQDSWNGRFSVDHCNGAHTRTVVGQFIQERQMAR